MTDIIEQPVCPCETAAHPRRVTTPAGRTALDRRVGDFISFRHALLRARQNERALSGWRPSAEDDLGVQMIEWWAYLADILTFYDERIADESYLNTASLPESVRAIIRLLGYRPRPGIGATGYVGALLTVPGPPAGVTLPAGFPIQSKPGPGQEPQIFETDSAQALIAPDGSISRSGAAAQADPLKAAFASDLMPAEPEPGVNLTEDNKSVLLNGSVAVRIGERLLIVKRDWDGSSGYYTAYLEVKAVAVERDPKTRPMTRVTFGDLALYGLANSGAKASEFRIMRSNQSARLYQFAQDGLANPSSTPGVVHLSAINRNLAIGDPVYVDSGNNCIPGTVQVAAYSEIIWYMNAAAATPQISPGNGAIPQPHTKINYKPASVTCDKNTTFHFGFADIGTLIAAPITKVMAPTEGGTLNITITAEAPDLIIGRNVLVIDARGNGAVGTAATERIVSISAPFPTLTPPLNIIVNALPVSRGQTVTGEILGSGNIAQAGQVFTLKKSPLTYLFDASTVEKYRSTLLVRVNGVAWTEVPNFLDQGPNDTVYVTSEDDEQKTRVQFGDGIHGARLPSGTDNVVATYRYGSGAAVPDIGALTNIMTPWPGLKSLTNPVQVGGGADPDPAAKIKQYAPRGVLNFGRAVSADDYESVAAQTPGVARARAYWKFNEDTQRAGVTVYVGDDPSAVDAARKALAGAADPNRPADVRLATALRVSLTLDLHYDPRRDKDAVLVAVKAALLDPDTGLFGANNVRIGQSLFRSKIQAVCLSVPGVVAVRECEFSQQDPNSNSPYPDRQYGYRFDPGEGMFYRLTDTQGDLDISMEEATDAR